MFPTELNQVNSPLSNFDGNMGSFDYGPFAPSGVGGITRPQTAKQHRKLKLFKQNYYQSMINNMISWQSVN